MIPSIASQHIRHSGRSLVCAALQQTESNLTCAIPPFELVQRDLTAREAFHRLEQLNCRDSQPQLTDYQVFLIVIFVIVSTLKNQGGVLQWNRSALAAPALPPLACYVSFVARRSDTEIAYSEPFKVTYHNC